MRWSSILAPGSLKEIPQPLKALNPSVEGIVLRPQRAFETYDEPHTQHTCDNRLSCPIKCALCKRYCTMGDHLHGLEADAVHLCGQTHQCPYDCDSPGVCEINTTPQSVETTYLGRYERFQYTKSTQVARRLRCAVSIPPGELRHSGLHVHSEDPDVFHYCEEACGSCGYICTLPRGHYQREHDTGHGSMERTAWAVEGQQDAFVEIGGRRYGAQDGGAPQLCSEVCRQLGRHAHIDFCQNTTGVCEEAESEHITTPMLPDPLRPKDWVSHRAFWARSGFRDPYSNEEQADFALCDARCSGPEHEGTSVAPPNPSYCTLPLFHPPQPLQWGRRDITASYVSNDGHSFACPNPNDAQQSYHVIFVLDESGSMTLRDRQPLPNQAMSELIMEDNDNRYGAVLSALYGFWALRALGQTTLRRDSYSVITFNSAAQVQIENNFTSSPIYLLRLLASLVPGSGTNFDAALTAAYGVMDRHWSTERSPVVIFLSDGECRVSDDIIYNICNRAVALGKPLSLHTVSFGQEGQSASLRRMATIAQQAAQGAPRDALGSHIPSTYSTAIDSIRLSETFLNIADSLKKPRAHLIRS